MRNEFIPKGKRVKLCPLLAKSHTMKMHLVLNQALCHEDVWWWRYCSTHF